MHHSSLYPAASPVAEDDDDGRRRRPGRMGEGATRPGGGIVVARFTDVVGANPAAPLTSEEDIAIIDRETIMMMMSAGPS
jgi:hypothetical protein